MNVLKKNMGPMGPRGLGPYVNIMDVLCIMKHYINIPVTVMVLLNIILTSRSLLWYF